MSATEAVHALIRRDIESGDHNYTREYGYDWFNLSEAEAEVFDLSLDDLPSLVAVWIAYDELIDACHMMNIPEDIVTAFLVEHPWMAEERATRAGSLQSFQRFAKLFGIPLRQSFKWWAKYDFWQLRIGVIHFSDERRGSTAEDDDLPF